jgi:SAM-dependent methyltransferase
MTFRPEPVGPAGAWSDAGFVARWIAADSMAEVLELPRRISAALVSDSGLEVRRVVDVGAGPGTYLRVFLEEFPEAEGVWVDASEAMLAEASEALADLEPRVRFVVADVRDTRALPLDADVVVSSRAVHHFRPDKIQAFYRDVAASLTPGGFLCNLDHFETPSDWKSRYRRIKPRFVPSRGVTGESHGHDAPPQLLDDHLRWLSRSGFKAPDVAWQLFWTALLVAQMPAS